jgi:hypothetical protein
MPGAELPAPARVADPLAIDCHFASVEPVRRRRPSGAIFESVVLGRLEFVRMPPGRCSFWFGHQQMPDSSHALQIVCEVDLDDTPGVDHVATVVSLRRNQVRDALACLPLLNERLAGMGMPATLREDDLVLTAIYLSPKPLLTPCHELEYHMTRYPGLLVTAAFLHGEPLTLRVDREA